MTISTASVPPAQDKSQVQQKPAPKAVPAQTEKNSTPNAPLSAYNSTYVSENYQVNKDGDSFEFNYSKTTIESTELSHESLTPELTGLPDGFNIADFQEKLKSQLIDMVFNAQESADKKTTNKSLMEQYGSDVIYAVPEGTEAPEVPEYWNAENTSNRLVEFAMSFKEIAGFENDVSYIETMRDAVVEGFKQAKGIIGTIDDSTHQLFNDTFELTMNKFDALLEKAHSAEADKVQPKQVNLVA